MIEDVGLRLMTDSLHAVTPHELALFSERIARSLADRPLELGAEEHRERVAAMLREVGGMTFYQLLSLGPTASPEKVHEGYERVARLVHPSHAPSLGLEGREGVLEVLFERATAAYVTLSHPGKRRDYDREIGPAGWPETTTGRNRAEENRDRARAYFNRATAFAAKDEFHFAIELLREAVRIDPQAKYFVLLGDLQTHNQHWLRHAVESYARALEIGGPDPQVEEAILRVRQRMTDIAAGRVPPEEARAAAGNGASPGQASAPAAEDTKRRPPTSSHPLSRTGVVRYEIESDGAPAAPPDDLPPDER
jgi:tetratricopeptide (TPR) repeat protein